MIHSWRPQFSFPSCYITYTIEEMALVQMIKQEIENMSPAQVWINYNEQDKYVRPKEDELRNAVKCKSSGSERIFSLKTHDGRFWQISLNDSNDYVLTQHNEEGFRSDEFWKNMKLGHYRTVIHKDDWYDIEKLILNKLTKK